MARGDGDGVARARAVLAEADPAAALLDRLAAAPDDALEQVRAAFVDSREERVLVQLDGVDIGSLRQVTRERLRIGALVEAGVDTVGAALRRGQGGLERVRGIGPLTATHVLAAAEQVATAMRESIRFRIDMAPQDPVATKLVQALYALGEADAATLRYAGPLASLRERYRRVRPDATSAASGWRRAFTWGARRRRADDAVVVLADVVATARGVGLLEDGRRVVGLLTSPIHPVEAWEDFRLRSVAYYSMLDGVVPTRRDHAATTGRLPADLVQRVESQRLERDLLTASLRGYQEFGARFALAQRRVVIGDEMGLGKTVQAIAVLAHRMAEGVTHALVVCPASVLAGWVRQIDEHSALTPHLLHGADRAEATLRWREVGGVGVTSFEGLTWYRRAFPAVGVLIVDEAHYVKNPQTNRARAVVATAEQTPDVLFLTGTVMENRLAEFGALVGYLQPAVAAALTPAVVAAGPEAVRVAVAPAYLRRNAEDVLEELPELVQTSEWEEFGEVDGAAYREAVAAGAFMAMRRAAFAVEHARDSAKLDRLVEIVEEALENGRKVVVFSFFRDVVQLVVRTLGESALRPLTGSVRPQDRQRIVDEFTTTERPCALISQIEVGGVGLNLQAASVVILCEPQTKPTTEAQAIARAHRMGQVETVQVHRLLVVDSVDEHLLRLLDSKRALFDAYARRSALAEEVGDAVDVSEAELARRIVDAERTRLFVDPDVTSIEDEPVEDEPVEDEPVAQSER